MSWVAVGVAAVTVVGGAIQNNQNKKAAQGAANAQTAAEQMKIDEMRRQFDLTRADQAPWLQAGQGALGGLQAMMNGDYSGFMSSPDYLYARDQGMEGVNRHLAANGGYYSGGGDADRMKFASGLATQNLGNYRGMLQSMAGLGQQTASGLGSLGMGMANSIGNAYGNMGNARASSFLNRADSNNQFIGGATSALANAYGNYMGGRQQSQPTAGGYSTPSSSNPFALSGWNNGFYGA